MFVFHDVVGYALSTVSGLQKDGVRLCLVFEEIPGTLYAADNALHSSHKIDGVTKYESYRGDKRRVSVDPFPAEVSAAAGG